MRAPSRLSPRRVDLELSVAIDVLQIAAEAQRIQDYALRAHRALKLGIYYREIQTTCRSAQIGIRGLISSKRRHRATVDPLRASANVGSR
jgi:hypothetical protein